jgi:hypothetical protein
MSAPAPAVGTPGARALRERLDACTRYAALVYEQIEALNRDDLEAFATLARERDALARRIDAAGEPGPAVAAGDASPDLAAALRQVLDRCVEADGRLLERLRALRDEARDGLQRLEARRSQIHAYVAAGRAPAKLDVRS